MNPGKLPLACVDAEVQAHCGFRNPGQACASRGDREEHLGAVTVTAGEPRLKVLAAELTNHGRTR